MAVMVKHHEQSNVVIFRNGTFGRWLGHGDFALLRELSALYMIVDNELTTLNPSAFFQVKMLQKRSNLKYKLSSDPESAVLILLCRVGLVPNSKAGFPTPRSFSSSEAQTLQCSSSCHGNFICRPIFWFMKRHHCLRWMPSSPFTGSNTNAPPPLWAHGVSFPLRSISVSLLWAAAPPLHSHWPCPVAFDWIIQQRDGREVKEREHWHPECASGKMSTKWGKTGKCNRACEGNRKLWRVIIVWKWDPIDCKYVCDFRNPFYVWGI